MNELKRQISEVISLINETTDCFYQQKDNSGYMKLETVLTKLITVMDLIIEANEVVFDKDKFNENLAATLEALENKDTVLLSDIMVYEINEQLKSIEEHL